MLLDISALARQTVDVLTEAAEDLDWEPEPGNPDDTISPSTINAISYESQRAELIKDVKRAFKRSFMQPYCQEDDYFVVENDSGESHIVPASVHNAGTPPVEPSEDDTDAHDAWAAEMENYLKGFEDYIEGGDAVAVEKHHGWIYWTSAPGYCDHSGYSAASTEFEALENLIEYHGDPDQTDEEEE